MDTPITRAEHEEFQLPQQKDMYDHPIPARPLSKIPVCHGHHIPVTIIGDDDPRRDPKSYDPVSALLAGDDSLFTTEAIKTLYELRQLTDAQISALRDWVAQNQTNARLEADKEA